MTWRSSRRCRLPTLHESDLADTLIPATLPTYPSHIFHFPELQHLHIGAELAPSFAAQPMKVMKINTERESGAFEALFPLIQRHWQGIVFPHVEYLETDRWPYELNKIPIKFWREFLLNVKEVNGHRDVLVTV